MKFFSRVTLGLLAAVPVFANATPVQGSSDLLARQTSACNQGTMRCCKGSATTNSGLSGVIKALLGIDLPSNGLLGLHCSPSSGVGVAATSCTGNTRALCCSNNQFGPGLLVIGCNPISIL
ncbi:hypothetical protein NMY22_g11899 [Coprinellus aureogranulatus]|nr:hypothetical protein NMY22_g11899 [Coprinellus aureogranulatus]